MEAVDLSWASESAERALADMGRRLRHVQRVAKLARCIAPAFGDDGDLLIAAAYLHDVGYGPELAITGFHPLDGARYVRGQGYTRLACLVAHHSGARIEADLRGLGDQLAEFEFEDSPLDQALTYCDMTTGPDGRRVRLEDRVAEINERHGPDSPTSLAINASVPEFGQARVNTERRVAAAGILLTGSLVYPR
jgi:hypothetical protein